MNKKYPNFTKGECDLILNTTTITAGNRKLNYTLSQMISDTCICYYLDDTHPISDVKQKNYNSHNLTSFEEKWSKN